MAHSESLYGVLNLTGKIYTETLLKDESSPDESSDSLHQVLTLTAKAYMETILKEESPPDGSF